MLIIFYQLINMQEVKKVREITHLLVNDRKVYAEITYESNNIWFVEGKEPVS